MTRKRKTPTPEMVRNVICVHGATEPTETPILTTEQMRGREFVAHYDTPGYQFAKRCFDLAVAGWALLLLFPVFFVVAALIVIEDGFPIIYKQQRVGQWGRPFWIYKFRSMKRNADEILRSDPKLLEEYQKTFKLKNDPRLLRCGKLIRSTSIDELPQFINILEGEMSVVGPRPLQEPEAQRYDLARDIYESMKPGCAGLWQAGGRSNLSFDERIMLDVRYYVTAGVRKDIETVWRTFVAVVTRKGAC